MRQKNLFSFDSIKRIKLDTKWVPLALLLSIPFLVLISSWIIYPFFPGDDTYTLAESLKESINRHILVQPVLERRPLFMPFLLLIHYGSGLSIVSIFRFLLPIIVTLSFLLSANIIIKQAKEKSWAYLIFPLVFFVSPYLIFQIQYAVPQSLILLFVIPVILFSIYGLKNRDLRLILAAIFISIISIGFHELGFILVFTSLIGLIVYLVKPYKQDKILFLKKALICLAIAFPYLIIFQIFEKLKNLLLVLKSANGNFFENLQWQWWYIDYYLNPDGIIFNYSGWRGLLWYAYLGILILVLFVLVLIFITASTKKLWINFRILKKNIVLYSPVIFFTTIFLFIAEIYPRISKIAFLPERAWIFLSIGIGIIFILFINSFLSDPKFKNFKKLRIVLSIITGLFILIGIVGSIFLSNNRGLLLSKDELGAINFIKEKTPKDSVFISTQQHGIGVPIFGERGFLNIHSVNIVNDNYTTFRETALNSYEKELNRMPAKRVNILYDLDDVIINKQEKWLINKEDIRKDAPVYFIYSLKRFDKIQFVGNPGYLEQNDYKNKDQFFKPEFLSETIYKDKNVVIYKLR
jgi:hypothetical protein